MNLPDLPRIPFSWSDLAEERSYALRAMPTKPPRFPFAQIPKGRLGALHQYLVYGGLLCGRPERREDNSRYVERAIEDAAQLFGVRSEAVVVVPPVLIVGEVSTPGGMTRAVCLLPPVCSMAVFDEGPMEASEEEGGFRTAVVWFQKDFGLPTVLATGP
jgi:hypothetical protein